MSGGTFTVDGNQWIGYTGIYDIDFDHYELTLTSMNIMTWIEFQWKLPMNFMSQPCCI